MLKGFEPGERPVRPAPVSKGLSSDSIVPHAPIDSLTFSVFDHARILTYLGRVGARKRSRLLYFFQRVLDASARSFVSAGASCLSCVSSSGCVRRLRICLRWGMCFILWSHVCCLRDEISACPGMEVVWSGLCLGRFYGVGVE